MCYYISRTSSSNRILLSRIVGSSLISEIRTSIFNLPLCIAKLLVVVILNNQHIILIL